MTVSNFPFRLRGACELAKGNVAAVQTTMKTWFDEDARVSGSALQARYSGPCEIKEKLNDRDDIVNTPDRRRRSRLCHINMLKPYLGREHAHLPPPEGSVKSVQSLFPLMCSLLTRVTSVVHPPLSFRDGLKIQKCCHNLIYLHLDESKREDVLKLIRSHVSLFSDVLVSMTSWCINTLSGF